EGRYSRGQGGATGGHRQGEARLHAGGELALEGQHFHRGLGARSIPAERPFGFEHVIELAALLVIVVVASEIAGPERAVAHGGAALTRGFGWLVGGGRGGCGGQNEVSSVHFDRPSLQALAYTRSASAGRLMVALSWASPRRPSRALCDPLRLCIETACRETV